VEAENRGGGASRGGRGREKERGSGSDEQSMMRGKGWEGEKGRNRVLEQRAGREEKRY
jgi:hypothetical protein